MNMFITFLVLVLIYQFLRIRRLKKLNSLLSVSFSKDTDFITTTSYQPIFKFKSSQRYKKKLSEIQQEQKKFKNSDIATVSSMRWVVGFSKTAAKDGDKLIKGISEMMITLFDNQCEQIIQNVSFRNFDSSKEKIYRIANKLNKLSEITGITINNGYVELKIEELHIYFECKLKMEAEREEQERIKEEMKEEAKVQKEIERAQRQAEKQKKLAEEKIEMLRHMLALDKANKDLLAKLKQAEQERDQAIEDSKRAISQAQLTKKGTVYVISNIGSFGENVYKIGMTRRLEPLERVRELGDASVPFPFDVHALIETDNAPELENKLHNAFRNNQVNRVNGKKEFFEVDIKEVAKAVKKFGLDAEFKFIADADEYRQSIALKKENKTLDFDESEGDE